MSADTATANKDVTSLEVRRIIRAPRARVFQAWTTPAEVKRWSAPGPVEVVLSEIDLHVGGRHTGGWTSILEKLTAELG